MSIPAFSPGPRREPEPQSSADPIRAGRGLGGRLRGRPFGEKGREARASAQGVRLDQIDLQIAIIERICNDLSDLLEGFLSGTNENSGIAIFNPQGFVWLSNHHNPVHALEEFDREVGTGSFGESLNLISKKYTLFELPEKDLPLWRDASVEDHPDTDSFRRVSF